MSLSSKSSILSAFTEFRKAILLNTSVSLANGAELYQSLQDFLDGQERMAIGISRQRIQDVPETGLKEFEWVCSIVEQQLKERLDSYHQPDDAPLVDSED